MFAKKAGKLNKSCEFGAHIMVQCKMYECKMCVCVFCRMQNAGLRFSAMGKLSVLGRNAEDATSNRI